MPQLCTVCTHPKAAEIDKAIISGTLSNKRIAAQFKIKSDTSIRQHRRLHLAERFERALERVQVKRETDLRTELLECIEFARKLRDACHRWLIDPKSVDKYALDPRAREVEVVYEITKGDKTVRERDTLEYLLEKIKSKLKVDPVRWSIKAADPRKLILESLDRFDKHLRMLGDLTGAFVAPATNPADIKREQIVALHQQINILVANSPDKAKQLTQLLLMPANEFLNALENVETGLPVRAKLTSGNGHAVNHARP